MSPSNLKLKLIYWGGLNMIPFVFSNADVTAWWCSGITVYFKSFFKF